MLGILPCAGRQSRMHELVFSKELLPLFDSRPVIQHSIDCLRQATNDLLAIVHPKKKDLTRYLKRQNVTVITAETDGPLQTLALAAQKTVKPFLFALTDTYYQPENAFTQLQHHQQSNVLGLFNSGTPARFDSVALSNDQITRYAVKIDPPLSPWTMGCGKIDPQLFKPLIMKPTHPAEPIFGHLFEPLARKGALFGIKFADSRFYDLGTPQNYIEYLLHRYPPSPTPPTIPPLLLNRHPLSLDIGAGGQVKQGFISVDRYAAADIQDDITSLASFADQSVDRINTTHCLEHLPNNQLKPALQSIYRVLKPGGVFTLEVPDFPWVLQDFLNTPEENRWGWKLQTVFGLQSRPGEYHQTGFSQERIGRLLVAYGFTQIKTSTHYSRRHSQQVVRASAIKPRKKL